MTTPDQPDEGQDSTTGAGRGHSAPRPVPPLTPAPSTDGAGTTDPDATSVALPPSTGEESSPVAPPAADGDPVAPARVSAFPSAGRSRPAPTSSDDDATRALPSTTTPPASPADPVTGDDGTSATRVTPVVPPGRASEPEPTAAPAPSTDAEATRVVPLADPASLAGSTNGSLRAGAREPLPDEEWTAEPTKRTGAHIWGVLGLLVAVPVAWFLLTDGALRTFYGLPPEAPLNPAGLLSLGGGVITLVIIALVTRVTSLGAWIWGGLVTLAGLAGLVVPVVVSDWLESSREAFQTLHEGFGTNLHDYLTDTSRSGLLLVFGIVLLLLAFVSHGARRSGRYEGRVRAERDARGH